MAGRTVDRENGCYYPTDAEVPERGKSAVAVSTFGTGSEQQERFGDLDLMQIAFVDAGVPDYESLLASVPKECLKSATQ